MFVELNWSSPANLLREFIYLDQLHLLNLDMAGFLTPGFPVCSKRCLKILQKNWVQLISELDNTCQIMLLYVEVIEATLKVHLNCSSSLFCLVVWIRKESLYLTEWRLAGPPNISPIPSSWLLFPKTQMKSEFLSKNLTTAQVVSASKIFS